MTKSRQELIERALEELGVKAAGVTPAAEDVAVIDDEIDPVMSDLATRDIWQWGSSDEFDEDAFVHLAKLLANSKARVFGVSPDETVRLMSEARLRQLNVLSLSGQHQTAEYF